MTSHPRILRDRVADVIANAPAGIGDYDLAEAVLDAILVDGPLVQTLRDGRHTIAWPDDPAPHDSRIVAVTRDLLDRIVDQTARLVADLRDVRAELDRIDTEDAALRAGLGVDPGVGPGVALAERIPEQAIPTAPIVLVPLEPFDTSAACWQDRHVDCQWPACRCGCHAPTGIRR